MSKSWININNNYYLLDDGVKASITNKIYTVNFDPHKGMFYLAEFAENFEFPKKIYDLDRDFINRVLRSWGASKGNMGILLTGIKGTGKTITGKMLAKESNLPIILITEYIDGVEKFISQLNFDCIIFCDEFEKVFGCDEDQAELLTLMDGVKTSQYRKMFILTSNSMDINSHLIDRPSRVRYIKDYDTMSLATLQHILKNELNNQNFLEDAVVAFSKIKFLTIDIVMQVLHESNIHEEPVSSFIDVFNASKKLVKSVYSISNPDSGEEMYEVNLSKNASSFEDGDFIYDNSSYYAICKILSSLENNLYKVSIAIPYDNNGKEIYLEDAFLESRENSWHGGLIGANDISTKREFEKFATDNDLYRGDRYYSHADDEEKKINWKIEERIVKIKQAERISSSVENLFVGFK